MPPEADLSSIAGYQILPLSLPPVPALPKQATHYLYLRPHEPKIPTASAMCSLFAVNVPFDATELHVKHLFSTQLSLSHGRIEEVQFSADKRRLMANKTPASLPSTAKKGKKRKRLPDSVLPEELEGAGLPRVWDRDLQHNGGTAIVVFVDRSSMDAALKAVRKAQKSKQEIVWGADLGDTVPKLGSSRYLNHHHLQYPPKAQLLESVNTYMTAFAEHEATQARVQAKRRQVPDEDGFVTVTRGSRNAPAKQEAALEQAKKQKERQKGLDNFYRFQMRERKKAKAGELVRRFEEDKEKVKRMREQRGKFRPE